jgi:hypothetical protein
MDMNKIAKHTGFGVFILSGLAASFYVGYEEGVESERSRHEVRQDFADLLIIKPCRDDYSGAARKWDCRVESYKSGALGNKLCALSLAVIGKRETFGLVFIDNLEIKAKYEVNGLTQLWRFDDGSSFELEPNGRAKYVREIDSGKSMLDYSSYMCSSVNS